MAVIFNIKCKSEDEMQSLKEKINKGLSNTSGYYTREIFIYPLQEDAFSLVVGEYSDCDLELDVHSSDLLERGGDEVDKLKMDTDSLSERIDELEREDELYKSLFSNYGPAIPC